ncbi:MAG: hypothetical protein KGO22_13095, partial [Gammaproteobacteria bacterium]|nr:hypothetical protein [Gammaproteobacteria bacterium]
MGTLSSVFRGWPAAVLLICVLGAAPSASRAADVPRHFDIPAQPLGAALDEFARQADVTLLFSSGLVANAATAGVRGELPVTAALGHLLGGTGLDFRQVSPSAIAIVASAGGNTAGRSPVARAGATPGAGSEGSYAIVARRSKSGPAEVLHR